MREGMPAFPVGVHCTMAVLQPTRLLHLPLRAGAARDQFPVANRFVRPHSIPSGGGASPEITTRSPGKKKKRRKGPLDTFPARWCCVLVVASRCMHDICSFHSVLIRLAIEFSSGSRAPVQPLQEPATRAGPKRRRSSIRPCRIGGGHACPCLRYAARGRTQKPPPLPPLARLWRWSRGSAPVQVETNPRESHLPPHPSPLSS